MATEMQAMYLEGYENITFFHKYGCKAKKKHRGVLNAKTQAW